MNIKDYILQHALGNLYWKDLEGRYIGCNLEFLKIAGLEKLEDIVGKTDFELFSSQLGDQGVRLLEEIDQNVMKNDIVIIKEEIGINVKGEISSYITKKIPLKDDVGQIIGLIGSSIDITQQKKAEQVKIKFIQNMSHDLRTPLTGLIGMATILEEEVSSQSGKEAAYNLKAAANILLDLLNGIIEFSKIESGESPIHHDIVNIKELLDVLIILLKPSSVQKNIKLSVYYDENVQPIFITDRIRLHRILLNLISNAIKFTPSKGAVDVSISLKKTNKKKFLQFSIKDTGDGIPKEKRDIIFSKFGKLASSYSDTNKGYGLGLAIVKQFVSDLNGEINLESEQGKGSKFYVNIPVQDLSEQDKNINSAPVPDVENESANFLKQFRGKINVLLVEDNQLVQLAVTHILKRYNCIIDIASSGEEAIRCVVNNDYYELVFMDLGLPDQNGCEVTPKILEIENKRGKRLPIIALSAHLDDTVYKTCLDAGMTDAVVKPLNDDKIIKILKKHI